MCNFKKVCSCETLTGMRKKVAAGVQFFHLFKKILAMTHVKMILASTRPSRKGPAVANWACELAAKRSDWQLKLLDLAAINLPFLDEPEHPRLRKYQHEHTKAWSKEIDEADAFIFVTPEYNFGYPATLKNALDFLFHEWSCKPVAFVSYGGVAGGTRSVQQLKQVVTALKMMPMVESVNIPFFEKQIDEQGRFNAAEGLVKAANTMYDELQRWADVMAPLRRSS
jgi:NAD(P)H-dependent FMN reductase